MSDGIPPPSSLASQLEEWSAQLQEMEAEKRQLEENSNYFQQTNNTKERDNKRKSKEGRRSSNHTDVADVNVEQDDVYEDSRVHPQPAHTSSYALSTNAPPSTAYGERAGSDSLEDGIIYTTFNHSTATGTDAPPSTAVGMRSGGAFSQTALLAGLATVADDDASNGDRPQSGSSYGSASSPEPTGMGGRVFQERENMLSIEESECVEDFDPTTSGTNPILRRRHHDDSDEETEPITGGSDSRSESGGSAGGIRRSGVAGSDRRKPPRYATGAPPPTAEAQHRNRERPNTNMASAVTSSSSSSSISLLSEDEERDRERLRERERAKERELEQHRNPLVIGYGTLLPIPSHNTSSASDDPFSSQNPRRLSSGLGVFDTSLFPQPQQAGGRLSTGSLPRTPNNEPIAPGRRSNGTSSVAGWSASGSGTQTPTLRMRRAAVPSSGPQLVPLGPTPALPLPTSAAALALLQEGEGSVLVDLTRGQLHPNSSESLSIKSQLQQQAAANFPLTLPNSNNNNKPERNPLSSLAAARADRRRSLPHLAGSNDSGASTEAEFAARIASLNTSSSSQYQNDTLERVLSSVSESPTNASSSSTVASRLTPLQRSNMLAPSASDGTRTPPAHPRELLPSSSSNTASGGSGGVASLTHSPSKPIRPITPYNSNRFEAQSRRRSLPPVGLANIGEKLNEHAREAR